MRNTHMQEATGSKQRAQSGKATARPSFGRRPDRHEASRRPMHSLRTQARPDSARGSSRAVGRPYETGRIVVG